MAETFARFTRVRKVKRGVNYVIYTRITGFLWTAPALFIEKAKWNEVYGAV